MSVPARNVPFQGPYGSMCGLGFVEVVAAAPVLQMRSDGGAFLQLDMRATGSGSWTTLELHPDGVTLEGVRAWLEGLTFVASAVLTNEYDPNIIAFYSVADTEFETLLLAEKVGGKGQIPAHLACHQTILVVEDGSGVDGANAYIDADFMLDYHEARGNEVAAGLADVERAIIRTTDYIEIRWSQRFRGRREFPGAHGLSFPRRGLTDSGDGQLVGGVPDRLKFASAEYALRALDDTLAPDPVVDASGQLATARREKVGPIEREVRLSEQRRELLRPYPAADRLLMPYLKSTGGVIRD